MCIDYRKLNKATRKDHYPLPLIDQMLERLSKNTHFCHLDGYSGFSQIHVNTADQEKTTFTVPMVLMLTDVFLFVYVMPQLLFKGVCLLSFMVFVKKLWRYSWKISLSMEPLLTIVSTSLIKFCRDVRRQIWCLTGRSDTLWSMRELFLATRFPRGVLKWTEPRSKQFKGCPIQGTSKVFVVFSVMLVSREDLRKTFIRLR